MSEEKSIDHRNTDNLVCPYCGYEELDSWELPNDGTGTTCNSCSKNFSYEAELSRYFTSWKVDCMNGLDHNWTEWNSYADEFEFRRCRGCGKSERKPLSPTKEPT